MEVSNDNNEYEQINQLYDECLHYLQNVRSKIDEEKPLLFNDNDDATYSTVDTEINNFRHEVITDTILEEPEIVKDKHDNHDVTLVEIRNDDDEHPVVKVNGHDDIVDKVITDYKDITKHPNYENAFKETETNATDNLDPDYETIKATEIVEAKNEVFNEQNINFKIENEIQSMGSVTSLPADLKSERLRRISQQLPKIVITQSSTSLSLQKDVPLNQRELPRIVKPRQIPAYPKKASPLRRGGYGDYPRRIVSKAGMENVALISNVPFERIRLLNDTFHTLINLRWRWIVMGTVVVHFAIWLVFAVFWYITALAHYDFEPNPPKKTCITGGKDFVTIFLASVEAQTTIGFGDRAIDEECPETIFLFIMQLILGTGLSGVLTCVVYAKLTRPEKLSRDGVGFSKKALIGLRDGRLCLMMRAWDLNYDHIICSVFTAHLVNTQRTKEGETIRFFAQTLDLMQRQFLLWPVTLVHMIDQDSPLYGFTPEQIANTNYEITLSLKGASASMGTFTQSQTSYMPKEVIWGHRFLPVVTYDSIRQKYVIDHSKLDATEPVDTPYCSASELENSSKESEPTAPGTPSSFSEKMSAFQLERSSSFKRKNVKI